MGYDTWREEGKAYTEMSGTYEKVGGAYTKMGGAYQKRGRSISRGKSLRRYEQNL